MNSTTELFIFELVFVMEFQLKLKILIFGSNLPRGLLPLDQKDQRIFHITVILSAAFKLKLTISIFLDKIWLKRVFPV